MEYLYIHSIIIGLTDLHEHFCTYALFRNQEHNNYQYNAKMANVFLFVPYNNYVSGHVSTYNSGKLNVNNHTYLSKKFHLSAHQYSWSTEHCPMNTGNRLTSLISC